MCVLLIQAGREPQPAAQPLRADASTQNITNQSDWLLPRAILEKPTVKTEDVKFLTTAPEILNEDSLTIEKKS